MLVMEDVVGGRAQALSWARDSERKGPRARAEALQRRGAVRAWAVPTHHGRVPPPNQAGLPFFSTR